MTSFRALLVVTLVTSACAAGNPSPDDAGGVAPSGSSGGGAGDAGAGGVGNKLPGEDAAPPRDDGGKKPIDASVAPGPPAAGDVIFTELFVDAAPPLSDYDGEFVELLNTTERTIELKGCVFDDDGINGDAYTIAGSVLLAPNELVVFAKKKLPADNGGVPNVVEAFGTAFSLANEGGTVSLTCGEVLVDRVTFDPTWPYEEGAGMQLSTTALVGAANDQKSSWCKSSAVYAGTQRGTPGTLTGHCQ